MAGQFEIFGDNIVGFRFRLAAGDDDVLMTSPVFGSKPEVVAAITNVRENAATGHVVDRSAIELPARLSYVLVQG